MRLIARVSSRPWHKGKIYKGRNGGRRRIVSVSPSSLSVEIVDNADSTRFGVGSVIVVSPQSMIRWTDNASKTIELVKGGE